MEKIRRGPKRILIDIDEELHMQIRIHASIRKISIKDYVTGSIIKQLNEEKKGQ